MRRMVASLVLLPSLGVAAVAPKPYVAAPNLMINGPMPQLPVGAANGLSPAPTPNVDAEPPHSKASNATELQPGVTARSVRRMPSDGYAPGSGYSAALERRTRSFNGLGNSLAPSLTIKVPLQ